MSFNSWDKLRKAQQDFKNPRFAVPFIDKALKKNKGNPYLKAWRADVQEQSNGDEQSLLGNVAELALLSGITDPELLSYIYSIRARSLQRLNTADHISVGTDFQKMWQDAAKALTRKGERSQLWNTLFRTAVRFGAWEDARFAVVNYNKEGTTSKKHAHYTLIAIIQLAAEAKADADPMTEQLNKMAKLQYMMARKLMKQAFDAPEDDPIAVKNIQDLRFMASVYGRQGECDELLKIWKDPPERIRQLMTKHRNDIHEHIQSILRAESRWDLIMDHSNLFIKAILSGNPDADGASKALSELCARRLDIWDDLSSSAFVFGSLSEGHQILNRILEEFFDRPELIKDRPIRVAELCLSRRVGRELLDLCKDFWVHHSTLPSCFDDLHQHVAVLSEPDDFITFIQQQTKEAVTKVPELQWLEMQKNLLKFEYLLSVAMYRIPDASSAENIVGKATALYQMYPDHTDIGFVAIYALLTLHHRVVHKHLDPESLGKVPFEVTANSRILLQAAMLARHLVAQDKEKQNRPLSILAARLHLNLGLGKCAFQLYEHAKCKEMLLDTLSPIVLSRISITHPFEIKGYQGFSPAEELTKVLNTIEKMEQRADSIISTNLTSFVWDRPWDAVHLRTRFKTSLTKHICKTELQRITRLQGNPAIPFHFEFKAYDGVCDNVDKSIFPNYEMYSSETIFPLAMPSGVPDEQWMYDAYDLWGLSSTHLWREAEQNPVSGSEPWIHLIPNRGYGESERLANTTLEDIIECLWKSLKLLIRETTHDKDTRAHIPAPTAQAFAKELMSHCKSAKQHVTAIQLAAINLRPRGEGTKLEPENEVTMFHENMLIFCYSTLEALRAVNKMTELMLERVVNVKAHSIGKHMSKIEFQELSDQTHKSYNALGELANDYVRLIKLSGRKAIKAQMKWGITGKYLSFLMTDGDIDYYTNEYIESALIAWNGVLKVKLK